MRLLDRDFLHECAWPKEGGSWGDRLCCGLPVTEKQKNKPGDIGWRPYCAKHHAASCTKQASAGGGVMLIGGGPASAKKPPQHIEIPA